MSMLEVCSLALKSAVCVTIFRCISCVRVCLCQCWRLCLCVCVCACDTVISLIVFWVRAMITFILIHARINPKILQKMTKTKKMTNQKKQFLQWGEVILPELHIIHGHQQKTFFASHTCANTRTHIHTIRVYTHAHTRSPINVIILITTPWCHSPLNSNSSPVTSTDVLLTHPNRVWLLFLDDYCSWTKTSRMTRTHTTNTRKSQENNTRQLKQQ